MKGEAMRAVVVTALHSGPEALEVQEMPMPVLDRQDLLVEVHAASINPADYKTRRHGRGGKRQPPFVVGIDVSGVVREVGAEARGFVVGDEVFGFLSLMRNGSYAEYVAADSRMLTHKPAGLSHVQAAALPCAALTAWEALYTRMRAEAGQTLLLQAAGGGVGHIALQLAKLRGVRVLATASSPDSIALCRELGADVVINYREENVVERALAETGGRGCEMVMDCVGGEVFDQSLDAVAPLGQIATIVEGKSALVHQKLFPKGATAHFVFVGAPSMYDFHPERQGQILSEVAKLAEAGQVRAHVGRVLKLEEAAEGHRLQETARVVGKMVMRVVSSGQ